MQNVTTPQSAMQTAPLTRGALQAFPCQGRCRGTRRKGSKTQNSTSPPPSAEPLLKEKPLQGISLVQMEILHCLQNDGGTLQSLPC